MENNPLVQELRKYAIEQGHPADDFVKYSLDAIQKFPSEQQTTSGESIVKIEPAELQRITGFSEKLITKYEKDGVKPLAILEMWALTKGYGTNISSVKQRLHDEDVPLEEMATILQVRNDMTGVGTTISSRSPMSIGPSITMLVDIYKRLNCDIDEFQQVMQSIDENRGYSTHKGNFELLKFIGSFVRLYLNQGQRDLDLTVDILAEVQRDQFRADEAHSKLYN